MKRSAGAGFLIWILIAAFVSASPPVPQAQETESTVPELAAFHEIIYPIWHTAYPEKDYAALRSYAPEVKKMAETIYSARLPGILHEKQVKWDQALAELRKSVDAYLAAAAGTDDPSLLEAAEVLHARYEMMVRTIRPALLEVDDFHKTLYVVYHKYLPGKDYAKITEASGDMLTKAEAITKATLPKRLESRAQAFGAAAQQLAEATKALVETAKSGQGEAIAEAVELVHNRYQALDQTLD
jgi:hypothetical protein